MHRRVIIRAAFATLLPALQLTSFQMFSSSMKKFYPVTLRGLSSSAAQLTTPAGSARHGRILSGIQPSGSLHLGNYLGAQIVMLGCDRPLTLTTGALRQWVQQQKAYDCYFCVVDFHAITADFIPKDLKEHTLQSAALYIACGMKCSKMIIF
jgi:hypothetical protein